jgi:hypothetical protein
MSSFIEQVLPNIETRSLVLRTIKSKLNGIKTSPTIIYGSNNTSTFIKLLKLSYPAVFTYNYGNVNFDCDFNEIEYDPRNGSVDPYLLEQCNVVNFSNIYIEPTFDIMEFVEDFRELVNSYN